MIFHSYVNLPEGTINNMGYTLDRLYITTSLFSLTGIIGFIREIVPLYGRKIQVGELVLFIQMDGTTSFETKQL